MYDVGPDGEKPEILFTENETNMKKLYDVEHYTTFAKDGFNAYVIDGKIVIEILRVYHLQSTILYVHFLYLFLKFVLILFASLFIHSFVYLFISF